MQKLFLFFVTLTLISNSYAQESSLPRLVGDTLLTTSGYKMVEKQDVKIGIGSMPDADFKFIRINSGSLFAYSSTTGYNGLANQANSFPRNQSGLTYKIKRFERRGNRKHGYVFYAIIGGGLINYEMDVENAILSGELSVPDEFKTKPKTSITVVEVKQQISVADELGKLKKLYDDGILSKEEFEVQKKKLLDK
jgi:hypothetical protein